MKKLIILIFLMSIFNFKASTESKLSSFTTTQEEMLQRFLKYVPIYSQSQINDDPKIFPMTEGQKEFAQYLETEIKSFKSGFKCYLSDDFYLYVEIPSNLKHNVPTLGVSCHIDVTPECIAKDVKPKVVRRYNGGDIYINEKNIIQADKLNGCNGKTIIHTDGTTLLGGDDKNGCAIAVSIIETLARAGNKMKHGKIVFAFCPNEDIGLSAMRIDTLKFNPDIIFDLDGEGYGKATNSNFTAEQQIIQFIGNDAHPSNAKALKMGDALNAAAAYMSKVPLKFRPENSDSLMGYIHHWNLKENSPTVYTVSTRIRYFDKNDGNNYKKLLSDNLQKTIAEFPNVKVEILDNSLQYENVAYSLHPQSENIIKYAMQQAGVPANIGYERGGTTASMFCAKGLKGGMCLFTGQYLTHSTREFTVLEDMYASFRVMLNAIEGTTKIR